MSDAALLGYIVSLRPLYRRMFHQHINQSIGASIGPGILAQVCTAIGEPHWAMRLMTGLGGVDSAAPAFAMWRMSRAVRASAALSDLFDDGSSGLDARLRAFADSDAKGFAEDFDRFLAEFGSRGANEWDLIARVGSSSPTLPWPRSTACGWRATTRRPSQRTRLVSASAATWPTECGTALAGDAESLGAFEVGLSAAATFNRGRERSKTAIIRVIHEGRMAACELGRRLAERGTIEEPADVFMLFLDELNELVAGNLVDVKDLVPPRREHRRCPRVPRAAVHLQRRSAADLRMARQGIAGGQRRCRGGHDLRRARLSGTSERPGPHRADTDERVGTRAGRRARGSWHRSVVDALVRAGRGGRGRRRRGAEPRRHREPRARHPLCPIGGRRDPADTRRGDRRRRRRQRNRHHHRASEARARMTSAHLIALSEKAYNRLSTRLEGLTDDEYLWEPDPLAWSVRDTPAGLRFDFGLMPIAPAPITTIAWRLTHIIDLLREDRCPRVLGVPPAADVDEVWITMSAAEAISLVERSFGTWRGYLDATDPRGSSMRPRGGPIA